MSYGEHLKALLRPLGLYQLEGSINGAELDSYGAALDQLSDQLDTLETETDLTCALGDGLAAYENLLRFRPAAQTPEELRRALLVLLGVGSGSAALADINRTIAAWGLGAQVRETEERYVVEVTFSQLSQNLAGLDRMIRILEEILPCHLQVIYRYWVTEWQHLAQGSRTWGSLSDGSASWLSVMLLAEAEGLSTSG